MRLIKSIIALFAAFFSGVCLHDINSIKRVTYNLKTDKIKKNIKIAVLADLHGKDFGNDNKKLIELIDSEKPDIIITAGDLVSAKFVLKKDKALSLCSSLAKKYPVYYGIGNHENYLNFNPDKFGYSMDELVDSLEAEDVVVLNNRKVSLDDYGIDIAGLNLPRDYFKKLSDMSIEGNGIDEFVGSKDSSKFEILIGHCPEYFEAYAAHGAELSLAGHLHGGVMGLPGGKGFISPKFRFFPKYAGGLYKKKDKRMIVSRGLGMHTIPLRLFNPSELVLINLIKK